MVRGAPRAPSQNAYRGAPARTQTSLVHVTAASGELVAAQVHVAIDALTDPDLVEKLHADQLNVVDGVRVQVPVLYHDPAAELMVLVLSDAHRHRELEERIAVLTRLAADPAPVPGYAKELGVAFGSAGLRAYLERRAQDALEQARTLDQHRDADKRRAELATREAELERRFKDVERRSLELESARGELEKARGELDKSRAELDRMRAEQRARVIAAAQQVSDKTVMSPAPEPPNTDSVELTDLEESRPRAKSESDSFEGLATGVMEMDKVVAEAQVADLEFDEERTGLAIVPPGSDPLTTTTTDLELGTSGGPAPAQSTFGIDNGQVVLRLVAEDQVARGFGGNLDVRVLLHRTQHYPLVSIILGPPPAFRVPSISQLSVSLLDVSNDHDRMVLAQLARKFELVVELYARGKKRRKIQLSAPLAENVAYILRAADDAMRAVAHDGAPDAEKARILITTPGFDLLGGEHPDAPEFRDEKMAQLETAQALRRAVSMARKYARPSREDYLVCTRGFPLSRWRELRRHVLESAVTWGIWMGPELAQVAVSEGLARSRRDLIGKLDAGFENLRRNEAVFDIDNDAADDNAKALAEEARALGVELKKKNGAVVSEDTAVASGSIEATPARGQAKSKSVDDLLAMLETREKRVEAAMELAERGEPRGAIPVISAVNKMSRAEAVRVLGMSVKFGPAAKVPLIDGLKSSKGFLRHGSALALGMLRDEDGTQAVIELLLDEPTEIWREIARAIGQVGPTALMPLASNFGKLGEHAPPPIAERVAWAMAHIGVRGGRKVIETMAGGQSVMAPVAKKALELLETAARDEVRVRPGNEGGRDVTVNRAFSRRFFEALENGLPEQGQQALSTMDASSPMELLDESDLVEDDELDESDLIES